jgi:hypothetical protein
MVPSASSSHRAGLFTRNCVGETPDGVAARGMEIEKSATAAVVGRAWRCCCRVAYRMADDAGLDRARASSGREVAIVFVGSGE